MVKTVRSHDKRTFPIIKRHLENMANENSYELETDWEWPKGKPCATYITSLKSNSNIKSPSYIVAHVACSDHEDKVCIHTWVKENSNAIAFLADDLERELGKGSVRIIEHYD